MHIQLGRLLGCYNTNGCLSTCWSWVDGPSMPQAVGSAALSDMIPTYTQTFLVVTCLLLPECMPHTLDEPQKVVRSSS